MELVNQQERREADLHWLAGFIDGEGCFSILCSRARRFIHLSVQARIVMSSEVGYMQCSRILKENELAFHVAVHPASKIGTKTTWHFTISGMKRLKSFGPKIFPYLRVKKNECHELMQFVQSRLDRGRRAPYSDEEIDCFIRLRDLHGYRLHESSETIRKTLMQGRYSPISDRKTESAAEMTAP